MSNAPTSESVRALLDEARARLARLANADPDHARLLRLLAEELADIERRLPELSEPDDA